MIDTQIRCSNVLIRTGQKTAIDIKRVVNLTTRLQFILNNTRTLHGAVVRWKKKKREKRKKKKRKKETRERRRARERKGKSGVVLAAGDAQHAAARIKKTQRKEQQLSVVHDLEKQ